MVALIIGRRRQGKSTLALALAVAAGRTTIIFDPNDQFRAVRRVELAELEEVLRESDSGTIVRLVPAPPVEDAWRELADLLDGGAWRWGDYTLVLDECSMLMGRSLDPALERYARTAPADVDVICTTHRPRDVAPLFRALATDWFVFQTSLELDLRVLRENLSPELAERVQALPQYHVAHHWLAAGGRPCLEVWDRPAEWFIDIGREN